MPESTVSVQFAPQVRLRCPWWIWPSLYAGKLRTSVVVRPDSHAMRLSQWFRIDFTVMNPEVAPTPGQPASCRPKRLLVLSGTDAGYAFLPGAPFRHYAGQPARYPKVSSC